MTGLAESGRLRTARDAYRAYETGDRELIEEVLSEDLVFSAPPDVGIDRATYFERCWPNAERLRSFEFVRLVELAGDEVLVTYESTRSDGGRFRNTEILGFDSDGRICRVEVYFGWDL